MRKILFWAVVMVVMSSVGGLAEDAPEIFGLSKPTAYTLREGEWIIGVGPIFYGVTDKFQLGTHLIADILTIFNVSGKLNVSSLSESQTEIAVAVDLFTVGFLPNEVSFSGVISRGLQERLTGHIGFELDLSRAGTIISGALESIFFGLDYGLSADIKLLGELTLTPHRAKVGAGVLLKAGGLRLKAGGFLNIGLFGAGKPLLAPGWLVDFYWRVSGSEARKT